MFYQHFLAVQFYFKIAFQSISILENLNTSKGHSVPGNTAMQKEENGCTESKFYVKMDRV